MMPGSEVVIDTNVAIDFLHGRFTELSALQPFERWLLPVAVVAEVLVGIELARGSGLQSDAAEAFLARHPHVPISTPIAHEYARQLVELRRLGTPIPDNDLWIAATCITLRVPLATMDHHFERIPSLSCVTLS